MVPVAYAIKDIEKVVKFDGKVKHVEVSRLTAPGENFLSLVLRVDIEVEKNGHSKIVSSVAKCLPPSATKEMMHLHGHTMKNEIRWYSEIIPLLKNFAKEYDITLDFYPEYYGSRYSLDSSKPEPDMDSIIILQNLIPEGYQNNDRYIGCDLKTTKAILKSLALFHALPITMKVKKPELFQILKKLLDSTKLEFPDKPGPRGPDGNKNHQQGPPGPDISGKGHNESSNGPLGPPPKEPTIEELIFEKLVEIPDFAPYISKIKPVLDKPINPESWTKLTREPWNTITHNDFWINNVLVNYSKEKDPLIKFVDFQMYSYGSYAKDLVFFLLLNVRNDVTKEHMDDLLRFYYEEFTSVLQKTHANLELNFEDFLEEVNAAAVESEVARVIQFATIVFGEKGTGVDLTVEEFAPLKHITAMIRKMNQYHKDKLLLVASEAIRRNWV